MDLTKLYVKQTAAAKAGFFVATGGRLHHYPRPPSQKKVPRSWRKHAGSLAVVGESEIVPLLEDAPDLKALTTVYELERRFPGRFGDKVRRPMERRVTQGGGSTAPEGGGVSAEYRAGRGQPISPIATILASLFPVSTPETDRLI